MKHEALIKRLETTCLGLDAIDPLRLLVDDVVAALAQPEQEPVAYLCENAVGHRYFRWKKPSSTYKPIPLYTTPPQRTWVGLTDEEKIIMSRYDLEYAALIGEVERKLKEKNNG